MSDSKTQLEHLIAAREKAAAMREKMKGMTADEKLAHKEEKREKARLYAKEQYAKKKALLASINTSPPPSTAVSAPSDDKSNDVDSRDDDQVVDNSVQEDKPSVVPPTPSPRVPVSETETVPVVPAPPKKKRKQPIVIVEHSDSSESDDQQQQVVYVKRRTKKKEPTPPPAPPPPPRAITAFRQDFKPNDLATPNQTMSMSSMYGNVF